MKPLRIIFLTQWFDPEPALKGLGFARALMARGHQVEVVTGFPNYPSGKVYPGYRIHPIRREMVDGVQLTRLALIPSHSTNKIGRVLNYVSFWLSSFLYLLFVARKADVVYVYHPPMTVGLAAAMARMFRRTPTVLDIQDMWPDTLRATGMMNSDRVLRFVGWVSSWVYCHIDHITVISPGFSRLLLQRGVPVKMIDVVYNWAPEVDCPLPIPDGLVPFRPEHKFRLLFAGNMGPAQGLHSVLLAAKEVLGIHPDIGFYFLGSGISLEALKTEAEREQLTNVTFLPRVDMNAVGAYLSEADALLVHLTDDPLFTVTIPSKVQASLAAGKPLIVAVSGDAADLVLRSGGAMVTAPNDPTSLAKAVVAMAALPNDERKRLGQNAAEFYSKELSLQRAILQLEDIFHTVIEDKKRKPRD